jgi:Uma2 family endonuclease
VATAVRPHRFDAEVYARIVESGALNDQRVELIDGEIVDMSPHSIEHAAVIERLTQLLKASDNWLRVQLPLHVAGDSVLEPDLGLRDEPAPADRHPTSASLVVEVAVSSLALDRGRKAELYAAAGVPVYWVIDVAGGRIEVSTDPQPPGGYGSVAIHRRNDVLPAPFALAVDDVIP